jgi:hypothetical protein
MDTTPASPHRRTWDTLPWLAAGCASEEDAALALAHLPDCAECQAELAFHQRVRAGLHAQGPTEADLPEPGPAFQRLLARLDAAQAPEAAAAGPMVPAAAPWARWLVAAVLVQAVGLTAAGLLLLDRGAPGDARSADYRTLSSPLAPRAATLRLVPAPGLDFGALRQLLAQTGMEVVEVAQDGSSLGLAPADGATHTTAAALPRLRAAPQVLLAEPLP